MQHHFITFINIMTHMPFWAWIIIIYLLFVGLRATKRWMVSLPTLFLIPLILIMFKDKAFLQEPYYGLFYGVSIVLGFIIGTVIAKRTSVMINKSRWAVELPGSYSTLGMLIIFFGAKCAFSYYKGIDPLGIQSYLFAECIIAGLFTGYFLGKAVYYTYRLWNAMI